MAMRSATTTAAQEFQCTACGATQMLPESPTEGRQSIRTGCDECDRITRWLAVQRSLWLGWVERREN